MSFGICLRWDIRQRFWQQELAQPAQLSQKLLVPHETVYTGTEPSISNPRQLIQPATYVSPVERHNLLERRPLVVRQSAEERADLPLQVFPRRLDQVGADAVEIAASVAPGGKVAPPARIRLASQLLPHSAPPLVDISRRVSCRLVMILAFRSEEHNV